MELRVGEVAKCLGVTQARVRELIASGRLKAKHHPTGYFWLVAVADVMRYVSHGKTNHGRPRTIDTKRAKRKCTLTT
jgi:excisionase family DNA binding protein